MREVSLGFKGNISEGGWSLLTKNEKYFILVNIGYGVFGGDEMKLIQRVDYLSKLTGIRHTPDIKVITGSRRSGKSKLLLSYIDWIKENDDKSNIICINLQEAENEELLNYRKLHDFILKNHVKGKNNYLFIDEVQLCHYFEKAINSIHSKEIYDIYVTGSNAFY